MVTKDTNILVKYGLGCVGCMIAAGETLGEGIAAHGLDADAVIAEINKVISENK